MAGPNRLWLMAAVGLISLQPAGGVGGGEDLWWKGSF